MASKLNRRTVGKIKAAYPESEAIAELATQVARLERAVRETEDIGNAACREAEGRAEAAENELQVAHDNVASLQGKLEAAESDLAEYRERLAGELDARAEEATQRDPYDQEVIQTWREAAALVRERGADG